VKSGRRRIKGLDVLFLEVNNLEESLAFYTEKLGFEIDSNDAGSEPPLATLRAGSLGITLAQNLDTMARRGRGVSFILEVDDVDGYYYDLKGSGVEINPPVDEGLSGRFITVQDPDNYRFFFVMRSRGVDT